jgi:F-type H+-transporting ATPase subunit a
MFTLLNLRNPLEQFDVFAVSPVLTNFSFIFILLQTSMVLLFSIFTPRNSTAFSLFLSRLFRLIASVLRENAGLLRPAYFTPFLYLFFTLLLANLAGLVPYSFTLTSSFAATFFLALGHFIGLNVIGAYQHG